MGIIHEQTLHRTYSREDRLKLREFGRAMREFRHQEQRRGVERRQKGGTSLRAMANVLGISASTLSMIEAGHAMPNERVLIAMAREFNFDVEQCKKERLPERKSKRGRPPGSTSGFDEAKWPLGREIFSNILVGMAIKAKMSAVDVALNSGLSIVYIKGLFHGTHPLPPNGVCRRLAKVCGSSPLRLLLLRMIAQADPELRQALMKLFLPKWGPERENGGLLSDRLMEVLKGFGWRHHV